MAAKNGKAGRSSGSPTEGAHAKEAAPGKAPARKPPAKKGGSAAAIAQRLLSEGPAGAMSEHGAHLLDDKASTATHSARVLGEVVARDPSAVASLVDRFVTGILSPHKRVVQTCAEALPAVAKVAPARVAKHLERLTGSFEDASSVGRDGLVHTFATLCGASVAYQKRLEPVLKLALSVAPPRTLVSWSKAVLPALKGEPHANARAVVEGRLYDIPRKEAQQIASSLGIRLRARR